MSGVFSLLRRGLWRRSPVRRVLRKARSLVCFAAMVAVGWDDIVEEAEASLLLVLEFTLSVPASCWSVPAGWCVPWGSTVVLPVVWPCGAAQVLSPLWPCVLAGKWLFVGLVVRCHLSRDR